MQCDGNRVSVARMARTLLAAIAALLLCAPVANATIVVQRDIGSTTDEIWAYDDDGGNGRLLVPDNFEDGLYDVMEPSTTATGSDVVFTGRTPRVGSYGQGSPPLLACGRYCYGTYLLSGGAIRRVTPPAEPCASMPCSIFEGSPELEPNGSVVFDRYVKLWSQCGVDWCTSDGQEVLARRPLSGGSEEATVIDTPDECGNVESPTPHPTTPGLVLFTGCYGDDGTGSNAYFASTVNAQGTVTNLYFDDYPLRDPAWSADGAWIVDSEGGTNPGLWISTADGKGAQHVVALPDDDNPIVSPRFAGGKVVFVHLQTAYSIDPAQCDPDPCTMAQAKKLTSTNDVASLAYTTGTPSPMQDPGAGGGDGGGGAGGGGVTCQTNCGVQPPPPPPPPPGPVVEPALDAGYALAGKRTLRGLLAGRLSFRLSCDCAVTATLRLGRTVVARGSGRSVVKLKPTKAGKRKLRRLRRAKLKLVVRAGDRSFTRTLTLRR